MKLLYAVLLGTILSGCGSNSVPVGGHNGITFDMNQEDVEKLVVRFLKNFTYIIFYGMIFPNVPTFAKGGNHGTHNRKTSTCIDG